MLYENNFLKFELVGNKDILLLIYLFYYKLKSSHNILIRYALHRLSSLLIIL